MRSRSGRLSVMWFLVVLLGAPSPPGGAAPQEEVEEETPIMVLFESPPADEPAVGDVVIEVDVLGDEPAAVVFRVDDEEVGRVERPPYRILHPFGEVFGPHVFEVEVESHDGTVTRARRKTPGVRVDDAISLELRQLYVTVSGNETERAMLRAEDFRVRDDGRGQELVTFEGGDAALTVALLVDSSDSMKDGRLEAVLRGVETFLGGMQELDEAATFLFADVIHHRSGFSQHAEELAAGLEGVEATGGTALNDVLYVAIRALEARQGRRVVVLLSDGFDIHSVLDIEEVLWVMRRSRSMVYWIALEEARGSILSPWRDSEEHAEERNGLRKLVKESGGRVVPIEGPEQAQEAFREILRELRSQFVIGYYPTVHLGDGRWHKVDVRVRRPGFSARTRGGYIDW